MELLTAEMIMEMFTQSRETTQLLLGAFVDAAWQNITNSASMIVASVHNGDWKGVLLAAILLSSAILLLYRLVRQNLMRTVRHLLDF